MLYINNPNLTPSLNLALEQYLLEHIPGGLCMLWRNAPAVIIGRNQSIYSEVNLAFTGANGVAVVRRLTGGGAVYHDPMNINYTFISADEAGFPFARDHAGGLDMDGAARPVLEALLALGVPAELKGRNDIWAGGAKISGAAQCLYNGRWLHHGTLLVDTDMDMLGRSLDVDGSKFSSRGIGSKRAATVNIKKFVNNADTLTFMKLMYERLSAALGFENVELSAEQWDAVRQLDARRYSTREWNYEQGPPYDFAQVYKAPGGTVQVNVSVRQGLIERVRLLGDFMGARDAAELQDALRGAGCGGASVLRRLCERGIDAGQYVWGAVNSEFAQVFDARG